MNKPHELTGFRDVFPVPPRPQEAADPAGWRKIEEALGLTLPDDYKWFLENYGTGCVSMFLWVLNPFSSNKNLNLIEQADRLSEEYRRTTEETRGTCPFPIRPEEGGLLPFAISDNGDVFFWLTRSSEPERWPVVANMSRSDVYEAHERTMTEFLAGVVRGEIESQVFEREFVNEAKLFVPLDDVEY